jgi:hypothetical protein
MNALHLTCERQAVWSKTATILKRRYTAARYWTFMFTVIGSLLAIIASQLPEGRARLILAGLSSLLIALAGILSARLLGQERAIAWTRSRAASEALKREAYKYAAQADPYEFGNKDERLNEEREKIEEDVADLVGEAVTQGGTRSSAPTSSLTPLEYICKRIDHQVSEYFEVKPLRLNARHAGSEQRS